MTQDLRIRRDVAVVLSFKAQRICAKAMNVKKKKTEE